MKKAIIIIMVLAMLATLFSACSSTATSTTGSSTTVTTAATTTAATTTTAAAKAKVAFLINTTTSQYSGGYYNVFKEEIKKYPDIDWKIYDGQENATLQAQQMDEAIANKVDLIMLWPQDSKALVASAKKAKDAGIKILVCNNALDKSADEYITAFFGPDYYIQGKIAADALNAVLPNGGTYVHLGCDPSYEAARQRLAGFQDQIKDKGYKLEMLGEVAKCDWKLELGKSNMTAFLSKFSGQIDAVYAVDDTIGNGGLQAVQEDTSGKNDQIKFVSIGGIQVILDAIKDGKNYAATIYQSPSLEAPGAIKMASEILKGTMPANKYNPMDTPIINKDNVADYGPAY